MPIEQLAAELILGVGAALLAANLWVLLQPFVARHIGGRPAQRPASTRRVVVNIVIGVVATLWGLGTLLTR